MSTLPPQIRRIADRYRTQAGSVRQNAFEAHTLASLSQRVLLSSEETVEVVSRGDLISLSTANGKFVFSSRALDSLRDRVISFIAGSITEELSARGFDEDRICFALERAFQKQFDLSRGRGENVISLAQTPVDDDDGFYGNAKRTAGQIAGAAAAGGAGYLGYKAYQALKSRANGNGTALPGPGGNNGSGPSPSLPGGGGPRTPRDPNSSAVGVDVGSSGNGQHPASLPVPITTASSTTRKTIGNSVVDPLADAVQQGKRTIAQRGSSIWRALRGIPLE